MKNKIDAKKADDACFVERNNPFLFFQNVDLDSESQFDEPCIKSEKQPLVVDKTIVCCSCALF